MRRHGPVIVQCTNSVVFLRRRHTAEDGTVSVNTGLLTAGMTNYGSCYLTPATPAGYIKGTADGGGDTDCGRHFELR